MSRRGMLVLAIAIAAAACSRSDPGSPAGTTSLSGTIAGVPFAAADATAFVMEPMACSNPEFGGRQLTIVEIRFSDVAGVCDLAVDTDFCGVRADARTAYIAVVLENVLGGAVPAIGPGTYDDAGTNVVDENGVVRFAWTGLGAVDASCVPVTTGMYKESVASSITLDEVGSARVRGHATMSFDNGDALSGDFDLPVCASSDAAQCAALKGGCTSVSCVP